MTMMNVSCSSVGVALLFVLVMICIINEGVRYRVKFCVFAVLSATSSSIFIPIMLLRPRNWRNALLPAWGCRQVAKLLGVKFEIRGHENIVKDTGCIVLINHQSSFDLCVLAELWPVLENCTVISKKEVLYFGTFGLASWLWGTVFIDRVKKEEAQTTVNSTAEIIKSRKAKLLLFPEGKRHANSKLMPFKKGAFHLAIESQTPIQPVVVSKYYFLNDKKKKFDSGNSFITILPSIPTTGMTKDDLPKLMDQAYERMNKKFQEATQEVLQRHMETLKSE